MKQPVARVRSARAAWFLRLVLYLVLVVSALVTMLGLPAIERRVDATTLDPFWLLAPSLCFGIFLLVYAIDRFRLVRFRSYPSGRALFQVFFGLVFLMLLLPSSIVEYRSALVSRPARDELTALMHHRDARVRAMACELAGLRSGGGRYVQALGQALVDRNARVGAAARLALRRVTGRDFVTGQQGRRQLEAFLRDHPLELDANGPAVEAVEVPAPAASDVGDRDAANAG